MTDPKYERQIAALVRVYQKAIKAILAELDRLDIAYLSRANSAAAIKLLDGVSDAQAQEMVSRIDEDEQRMSGKVDGSVFNEVEEVVV